MSTKKETNIDIAGRLLALIKDQANGNAALFAKKAGVLPATLHNYLKGREPSTSTLSSICKIFNVNLNWLITGCGGKYIKDDLPSTFIDKKAADSDSHPNQEEPVNIDELREMTTVVLETNTVYRAALAANVRAFYRAVKNEEEKMEMHEQLKRLEAKHDADMQELKQMIMALNESKPEKKAIAA